MASPPPFSGVVSKAMFSGLGFLRLLPMEVSRCQEEKAWLPLRAIRRLVPEGCGVVDVREKKERWLTTFWLMNWIGVAGKRKGPGHHRRLSGRSPPLMVPIVFTRADRDSAFAICSLSHPLADDDICEKQQIHKQKGHHNTDPRSPSSCGMLPYQRRCLLINRLSSLALSPINKSKVGGISIAGIDVPASVLSSSPIVRSIT